MSSVRYDIFTFGVPMVEISRREKDCPLNETGAFIGPFPAGDPGILVNAAVKLGCAGGYAGAVGADDFGASFLECMDRNKVDRSEIRVLPDYPTGMSVVANFSDGTRKFIFTVPFSAAAQLGPKDFREELLDRVDWLHVSGFALSVSESIGSLHDKIMDYLPKKTKVSFDPNFRKDIIDYDTYLKRCKRTYERCDLFLPSRGEAGLFQDTDMDEVEMCRQISESGKKVVLKDGCHGAYGFENGKTCFIPAYPAAEKDPTGAGDIFGGAVIAALRRGEEFFDAVKYGCAAGTLAVERVGLMDIAPSWEELETVIKGKR